MQANVHLVRHERREPLPAVLTHIWFLSGVRQLVPLQALQANKSHGTVSAGVWLFIGVDLQGFNYIDYREEGGYYAILTSRCILWILFCNDTLPQMSQIQVSVLGVNL